MASGLKGIGMIRCAAVCLALLALVGVAPEPLTVSAAVSLTDALEAIAKEYAAAGGGPVRFNFAASSTLARQLVNGAPADMFISADEAQMDVAAQAGAIDPASRRPTPARPVPVWFRGSFLRPPQLLLSARLSAKPPCCIRG